MIKKNPIYKKFTKKIYNIYFLILNISKYEYNQNFTQLPRNSFK
jgi:hypothetical protein